MKKLKTYLILNLLLVFYSIGGIVSKIASTKQIFSVEFILLYGTVLFIMGVYAVIWQQILKKVPLNVAYANKSVTLVWGMVWGAVFFQEHISPANIVGAAVVLSGVLLMVTGGRKQDE